MWRWGKDFVILKMLPSGVYHYRFIVDERLRYAPDLPWERDDSGNAYNVLDLQVILKNPLHYCNFSGWKDLLFCLC